MFAELFSMMRTWLRRRSNDEFDDAWRTTDRLAALIPVGVEKRTGSHGFREKAKWAD